MEKPLDPVEVQPQSAEAAPPPVEMGDVVGTIRSVPVSAVATNLLVRDRVPDDAIDQTILCDSIRDLGLLSPIHVMARSDGQGYELVHGARRLRAFGKLAEDTGGARFDVIPAIVLPTRQAIPELYRQMLDANVTARPLSLAEMAIAAANFAADPATSVHNLDEAVGVLFGASPMVSQNAIRVFGRLMARLGDSLLYPAAIPEKLGVALMRRLDEAPWLVEDLREALAEWDGRTLIDELEVLEEFANRPLADKTPERAGARSRNLRFKTIDGGASVTLAKGQISVALDVDFTRLDRRFVQSIVDTLAREARV